MPYVIYLPFHIHNYSILCCTNLHLQYNKLQYIFFKAEKSNSYYILCWLHTEPLFKIYKLLKIEVIYNCRLLVLYYNLLHNKVLQYLSSFLQNTSLATNRYPIRHPRLQPPFHSHAFISQTCKYNLPDLLNSINNLSDELTVIINIIIIIILKVKC